MWTMARTEYPALTSSSVRWLPMKPPRQLPGLYLSYAFPDPVLLMTRFGYLDRTDHSAENYLLNWVSAWSS